MTSTIPPHTDLLPVVVETVEPSDAVLLLSPSPIALLQEVLPRLAVDGHVVVVVSDATQIDDVRQAGRGMDHEPDESRFQCHRGDRDEKIKVVHGAFNDLALDVAGLEERLALSPPKTLADLQTLEETKRKQKSNAPLVRSVSVDAVIVVNALRSIPVQDRLNALAEMYRVLKKNGRLSLIEVVSDEPLSDRLRNDPETPGVLQELELLEALESCKFHGITISEMDKDPCATVEGIDFRRLLIHACKGKEGLCVERHQGVIYKGPWKIVEDDDGHVMKRGQRFAVCDKTFNIYKKPPYAGQFVYLEPAVAIPFDEAKPWDVRHPAERLPSETKGTHIPVSSEGSAPIADTVASGYITLVEWWTRDGVLSRRAKVSHRYRGYFESAAEALDTARKAFPDASRYNAVSMSLAELAERRSRTGRNMACPLPIKPSC